VVGMQKKKQSDTLQLSRIPIIVNQSSEQVNLYGVDLSEGIIRNEIMTRATEFD
jgi:hypothetical protein